MAAIERITLRSWTPEQIDKLKALAASGASMIRIQVVVKKRSSSVLRKARELGLQVRTVREIRAKIRDAERDLRK